jgi:CBS domain-containing membrane protein
MAVKVRDLMQVDVVTLDVAARMDVAEQLMRVECIRHLPVLAGGKVTGIVTQRDLYRAATSSLLGLQPGTEEDWLAKIPVSEAMTTPVFTAHPDASLGSAAEMMVRERVGCLPVVADGRMVGLLAEIDCVRYLAELLRREESAS